MKEIIKLGLTLFIITAVCAGLLGAVNSITAPIIEEKKELTQQEAMKKLIQEATTFIGIQDIKEDGIKEVYIAQKEEEYLGMVVKVAPEGYGGAIEMLVGISKEETVTGIQILTHAETPGLGANITKESFKDQFIEKKMPIEVVKGEAKEGEISAITGATITSRAITEGVNKAIEYVSNHKERLIGGGR